MNIVDYWKELVSKCQSAKDFGVGQDFVKKLDENVPDWRQQVKDRNLWPDLHSYTANFGDLSYFKVILREAGLDFAYYLIQNQWGKRHIEASLAISYCLEQCNLWNSFPDYVQEKVLEVDSLLRTFLNECQQNVDVWSLLTEKQKSSIIDNLAKNEEKYVSDILLFKLWGDEFNYKVSPYIIFKTDHFKHIAEEIVCNSNRDDFFERMIEHRLEGWDIPRVDLMHGIFWAYTPSEKLKRLKNVAQSCMDETNLDKINSIANSIQNQLHHNRLRE